MEKKTLRAGVALLVLLLPFLSVVYAHDCANGNITVGKGQTLSNVRIITADLTETTTAYQISVSGDSGIATATPSTPFSSFHGEWSFSGVEEGKTTFTMKWDYKKGTPQAASGTCPVMVNVDAPAPPPGGANSPLFPGVQFYSQGVVGTLGPDNFAADLTLWNTTDMDCPGTIFFSDGAGQDPQIPILVDGQDLGFGFPFTLSPWGTNSFSLGAPPGASVETFALGVNVDDPSCLGHIHSNFSYTVSGNSNEIFSTPASVVIANGSAAKLPINGGPGRGTGVAVVGLPLDQEFPDTARISYASHDAGGLPSGPPVVVPFDGSQSAQSLDQIFPDLPSQGTVTVSLAGANPDQAAALTVVNFDDTPGGVQFFTSATPPDDPDCFPSSTTLCLNNGRFQVEVEWDDGLNSGPGQVALSADDTGYFYFFDRDNYEMLVKVLNGCPVNDHFWVFAAGLTDVEIALNVTDTNSGEESTYTNPLGTPFSPVTDTQAFATCP